MVCFSTRVATEANPRPGISRTEYYVFYLNYVIKCSGYFSPMILTFWLHDAGYTIWEVTYAWIASVLADILAPLVLGPISDSCKIRIPLLSLCALLTGVCDISLPWILDSQPVWIFCCVNFLQSFSNCRVPCDVWLIDWVPDEEMAMLVNKQIFCKVVTHAFSCSLAGLLYEPVGPNLIYIGYGILSLFSALLWSCHKDNPLGMEATQSKDVTELTAVMDGPLKRLLPDTGCFLLGWPLFIMCTSCLALEAMVLSGIYASGFVYSKEIGVSMYTLSILPIGCMITLIGAQTVSAIIPVRLVAAALMMLVIGLTLPVMLGVQNTDSLLVSQYISLFTANYFMYPVIWTILLVLFNEAWKARLLAVVLALRSCFEIVGVYSSAFVLSYNRDLVIPFFSGCVILFYGLFEVASWSLPPTFETTKNAGPSTKNYCVL